MLNEYKKKLTFSEKIMHCIHKCMHARLVLDTPTWIRAISLKRSTFEIKHNHTQINHN